MATYLEAPDILMARITALREGTRTAIETGIPANAKRYASEFEDFLLDGLVRSGPAQKAG